jgi:hypothetical protein
MTAAALEVPSGKRLSNKDGLDEILRIFSGDFACNSAARQLMPLTPALIKLSSSSHDEALKLWLQASFTTWPL